MIKLTINGKAVTAGDGSTILEAALSNNIYIPNLCHDKRLRPYGGCRLCIVEVEGQRRLFAACSSPAEDGMIIHTETPKLRKLRQTVVELLLVHHPLDCPECDKAGECDLQDLAYDYGKPEARFIRHRKETKSDIRGPLIELTSRRCILCGKCVRICAEHQGRAALGLIGRGFPTVVQPAFGEILECDYCGQCLDICPTGAILSKPYKFTARSWFLEDRDTICPFCGVGCTLTLGIREGKILRSRGKMDNGVSKGNLCGRGRFGIDYIYNANRLKTPLIKEKEEFIEVSWEDALSFIAKNLKKHTSTSGLGTVGAIGSPRCTNEDNYVFQKFMRSVIGSQHIDSSAAFGYGAVQRVWESTFGQTSHTVDINSPLNKDLIMVLESDVSVTHPIFGLNILQARREGAEMIVADSRETKLTRHSSQWVNLRDGALVAFLNGLMHVILERGLCDSEEASRIPNYEAFRKSLSPFSPETVSELTGIPASEIQAIAEKLSNAQNRLLTMSFSAAENTKGIDAVYAAANLVNLLGDDPSSLQIPAEYSNTFGMYHMGVRPLNPPSDMGVREMLYSEGTAVNVLYVMGEDPAVTFPDTSRVVQKLKSLDFLIVQDIFLTETAKLAHVVLPASSWAEKDGTFTNTGGLTQHVRRLVDPAGQSVPDWMILKNLALTMEQDMGLRSLQDIQSEIREKATIETPDVSRRTFHPVDLAAPREPDPAYPFRLVIRDILQHSGIMSTSSKSLDLVVSEALLEVNEEDAKEKNIIDSSHVKLKSRRGTVFLKARISEEVPRGTVFVPSHFPHAKIHELTRVSGNGESPIIAVALEKAI